MPGSLLSALKPKYKRRHTNPLTKKATTLFDVKLLQHTLIAAKTAASINKPA